MRDRRYSEDEIARILSRASEPGGGAVDPPPGRGLSLTELEEIGAEVGLDPARIREAAREIDLAGRRGRAGRVAGMPTTVQLERVVPVRLEPDDLAPLLDLIRDEFARQGVVEEVLGGFEWRARSGMGGRYVSIRPEGEQTRIRVLGNYRDGLLGFTLGIGPIAGATTGALAAALGVTGPLALAPIGILGGALVALLPWRVLFSREADSAARVLEALDAHLRSLAAERERGA